MSEYRGLLGMIEDADAPYYMVGQRSLRSSGGDKAYLFSPGARHEHFIRNDGKNNFGFGQDGVFQESAEQLLDYGSSQKYPGKRYKASIIEQALENWHSKNDFIDDFAEELGVDIPPYFYKEYSPPFNNCQHFVRWIDREYQNLDKDSSR